MHPNHDRSAETPPDNAAVPAKRPYVAPTIERLGNIVELTQGLGSNNQFDGGHPPGQNKSII